MQRILNVSLHLLKTLKYAEMSGDTSIIISLVEMDEGGRMKELSKVSIDKDDLAEVMLK